MNSGRGQQAVLTGCVSVQILKEPKEVRQERIQAAKEANATRRKEQEEKNEAKTKMKGKNKPSRRFKKKQSNIIEERKV